MTMPAEDGKRLMHANLKLNGGDLMLADEFPEYSGPGETGSGPPDRVVLHVDVSDVDAAYARGIEAGATERMPPADMFWGQRYAQFADPYGFVWSLGGPIKGGM
jgi:PhnB protein